jgi:hypothetical protein
MSLTNEAIAGIKDMAWNDADYYLGHDAQLLIEASMDMQALDTCLCDLFERRLGLTSTADKIAGIAEFHRQVLERMGLQVPERGLTPDPLALAMVYEPLPFRGDTSKQGNWHPFTDEEIDMLHKAMLTKRPELLTLIELSWKAWVKKGRPDDFKGIATGSALGMETFVMNERPDIGSMDAGNAACEIFELYKPYNRSY